MWVNTNTEDRENRKRLNTVNRKELKIYQRKEIKEYKYERKELQTICG